jgi:putrescine transport system permease protein
VVAVGTDRKSLREWFDSKGWRDLTIGIPYLWLLVFFLLPTLIVLAMSLGWQASASPPIAFSDVWPFINGGNFLRLFEDSIFVRSYFISVMNALGATFLCLLIGYPMALALTRVSHAWRSILLMLVILPFWTSFLLRVYAWIGLMGSNSWFNRGLTTLYNLLVPQAWTISSMPLMNTNFAVVLVMVYSYLPFMILPLYANLEKLDQTLNEAAMDLGSRPWQVFKDITLPLSVPGIVAGGLLVFIPASGELVIPSLVGNSRDPMIGRVISDQFASNHDWPMASAVAVSLLIVLVAPMMAYSYFESRAQSGSGKS